MKDLEYETSHYDKDTRETIKAKGVKQVQVVKDDKVFVHTYKSQKITLPAEVYVIKLILRPQPLEFD